MDHTSWYQIVGRNREGFVSIYLWTSAPEEYLDALAESYTNENYWQYRDERNLVVREKVDGPILLSVIVLNGDAPIAEEERWFAEERAV